MIFLPLSNTEGRKATPDLRGFQEVKILLRFDVVVEHKVHFSFSSLFFNRPFEENYPDSNAMGLVRNRLLCDTICITIFHLIVSQTLHAPFSSTYNVFSHSEQIFISVNFLYRINR